MVNPTGMPVDNGREADYIRSSNFVTVLRRLLPMHAGPSDHAGPSSSAEMRQNNTNISTANPFVARPATYYGDGPFDPPSSDDEGEEAEGSRRSFEDDAENVLLLNVDKSGPSSPGTAERGDENSRPTDVKEKVCPLWLALSHSGS